ncbi:hypothetical protein SAMN05421594_1872 [Chryseobacterium oleae]|uniref:Lipoprotein n=1 Tax=Chryseobacterium oleae TaxID=491207 RepID=A0A1I4XI35_CHROL|nr:hypothetical protein [Chryseobacterium oleae]SFN25547.1 hypothetical protein SAMN05421594_1872 [Chryseobacterium oleae]
MIYRFLLVLTFLLGITASCKKHDSKDNRFVKSIVLSKKNNIPEIWRWKSEDKSQEFTLKILRITKDSLYAQYCAVYNNGQKLDCDFEKNINIKTAFNIEKNAYVGNFFSFFNPSKGVCLIQRTGNGIVWEILEIPNGEYYAPNKCILKKEETIEEDKNNSKELTKSIKSSSIFPIDYKNFTEKIKLEILNDNNIKKLFLQKYQLGIDAIAELPSNGDYKLYIVNNVSGESDLLYLITIKGRKLIDGLEIANSNGDSDDTTVFSINEIDEIFIYSEKDDKRKLIKSYSLSDKGNFNIKK